jgi:hypothetical protein
VRRGGPRAGPRLSRPHPCGAGAPGRTGDRQGQEFEHNEDGDQQAPGEELVLYLERLQQTGITDDDDDSVLPDGDR